MSLFTEEVIYEKSIYYNFYIHLDAGRRACGNARRKHPGAPGIHAEVLEL